MCVVYDSPDSGANGVNNKQTTSDTLLYLRSQVI